LSVIIIWLYFYVTDQRSYDTPLLRFVSVSTKLSFISMYDTMDLWKLQYYI